MKILVAMSGGVDSSLSAVLLKQAGHEVIGATMLLYQSPGTNNKPDAVADARKAAAKLGIPHYIIDLQEVFKREIISYFCREYQAGRTPNPCVRCNQLIKFGIMMEQAWKLGADCLSTGHYARVERDGATGKFLLKKGWDPRKDQSYFLCHLKQEQLAHTLFPLGEMSKTEVRKIARELGLPSAERPESQEICFVPGDDYATFLESHTPASEPGPIYDTGGKRVGQHRGIMYYTIGQRRGLGIAAAEPLYVTAIDAEKNAVTVGNKADTYSDSLTAGDLNWTNGTRPEFPLQVKARIRYHHPEAEAIIEQLDKDKVYVKFAAPQMAITPGQAVVFYDGDTVIGGGTIIRQGR